ncbi:ABC transporter ATP-binding protein [Corynebacterium lowii]|uniref:Daunorubicin/doxorubicin resistance ATP-binding protein DrrA n=1 Tax=Corynebacterium lowii TaxID=1544413 RepID=A0A0Q0YYI7_9CORY|nr:ABC transporter ATP-binding protein [Corynebacterium lowii]KQB87441.1 Daunorubicin/doxorubicin resistance ATP-binding protein DrrA [Corynebacterium lowii]MDP9851967.1 ABC-2 type transport system ATP-binding protein [Corynebacterium lowii]
MGEPILRVDSLRRDFAGGSRRVFDGVSFSVGAGEIVGLLGPNGAGKTTTVRVCSTLLTPTSGSVEVCGISVTAHPRRARRHIGVVLGGERGFYLRASARDNLLFFADILGVPGAQRRKRVDEVLRMVELKDREHDPVENYSRGMRQRLHIARGLLHEPELLLLDEPTNGLDPDIAEGITALIDALAHQHGTAIVLTTHLLGEMEKLADRIHVLMKGRIGVSGTAREIAQAAGVESISTFTLDAEVGEEACRRLQTGIEAMSGVTQVRFRRVDTRFLFTVAWSIGDSEARMSEVALDKGLYLDDVVTRPPSLEEGYLALVRQQ